MQAARRRKSLAPGHARIRDDRGGILDLPEAVHELLKMVGQRRGRLHLLAQPLTDAFANRAAGAVIDLDAAMRRRFAERFAMTLTIATISFKLIVSHQW